MNLDFRLRGDFDVAVIRNGERHTLLRGVPNLITDGGLDQLGTSSLNSCTTQLAVGTGNTPPAFSDSQLTARVASQIGSAVTATLDGTDYVWSRTYTFATGAAAGVLAELGLHTGGSQGHTSLFTRALFRDPNGDPITVTVLPDEQLQVTYRVRVGVSTADSTLTTTQQGVEYSLVMRQARRGEDHGSPDNTGLFNFVLSFLRTSGSSSGASAGSTYAGASSAIGDITGIPTGTSANMSHSQVTRTAGPYTPGNHYRDDVFFIPLGAANRASMGAFLIYGEPFWWQVGITPRVTKTANNTLSFTGRTSWGRA